MGKVLHKDYKKACVAVFERDKGCCVLCGRQGNDFHHVIFRSQGGKDVPENLVVLCRNCHDKAHGIGKNADQKKVRTELQKYLKEVGKNV